MKNSNVIRNQNHISWYDKTFAIPARIQVRLLFSSNNKQIDKRETKKKKHRILVGAVLRLAKMTRNKAKNKNCS